MSGFYARSTVNPDRFDWQPLDAHLIAVGQLAAARAARFGASVKYTQKAQDRVRNEGPFDG